MLQLRQGYRGADSEGEARQRGILGAVWLDSRSKSSLLGTMGVLRVLRKAVWRWRRRSKLLDVLLRLGVCGAQSTVHGDSAHQRVLGSRWSPILTVLVGVGVGMVMMVGIEEDMAAMM